ncbi:MAG: sulfatase-like hydrolase/transferase [Acidobacteria bacterium]|nr:sulfatase-like hydrolase/transferase [Acidobacteriota bacterium]
MSRTVANTIKILAAAAAVVVFFFLDVAPSAPDQPPPNVVLIISDDHAWTDYGFMGHEAIRTPHLDKLASESLVFTRGYVPTSLCRPSLATMMTGLYPHQHGITGNDPDGAMRDAANRERMVKVFLRSQTITAVLGRRGYVSHQSGKWWEGQCQCCFDECMTHGDVSRGGRHGDEGLKIGRETMQPVFDFLDQAGDKPFFVWYAPFMPHTPHDPPQRLLDKYLTDGRPEAVAKYYAMVEWFDETVGQLLGRLEERGLAENTLVLYVSDNGWIQPADPSQWFQTRSKVSPYDAGLRTPIMARWPGKIAPRRDERTLVSSIDLAPTIYAAAGVEGPDALPGIDLRNAARLMERKEIFGSLFAHTAVDVNDPVKNLKYRWALREDGWKLIEPYRPNAAVELMVRPWRVDWMKLEPELYNVLADPGETDDQAAARPELVERLGRDLQDWWSVPR